MVFAFAFLVVPSFAAPTHPHRGMARHIPCNQAKSLWVATRYMCVKHWRM